jgi:DNA topoisomerase-6 subunit B
VAKLKEQLQRMALKRTGGQKTDELLGKNGSGPEGLPHSIIVTPEGIEGEVPGLIATASPGASANGNGRPDEEETGGESSKEPEKGRRHAKARRGSAKQAGRERQTGRKPRRARAAAKPTARAMRRKA